MIFNIPAELGCEILSRWISSTDLVRLDSACCAKNARENLFALYKQEAFVMNSIVYWPHDKLKYLINQNIKSREFCICNEIEGSEAPYLTKHGQYLFRIVSFTSPSPDLLRRITHNCPHVTRLTIVNTCDSVAGLLQSVVQVEVLELNRVSDSAWIGLEGLQLNFLRSLSTRGCSFRNGTMSMFLKACPHLLQLSIKGLGYTSSSELSVVAQYCPHLKALCWNSCDDASLEQVSLLCPLIVHLDVSGSRECTDAGILSVASRLKLQSICLPHSTFITNTSVQYLMQHCANTLQVLQINQSVGYTRPVHHLIDAAGVSELHRRCVHFKRFVWFAWMHYHRINFVECIVTHLSTYKTVTNSMLAHIAQHCTLLQHLDLSRDGKGGYFQPTYSSNMLRTVVECCSLLKSIRVHKNVDLTPFKEVTEQYPRLISSHEQDCWYDVLKMPI